MPEQTEPIESASTPPVESAAPTTPVASPAPAVTPITRRSVALPLLPLLIVGGIIVALVFFGGGVAIGFAAASHDGGSGNVHQYRGGQSGYGFGNGFGQNNGGQNSGNRPGDRSTTAPKNG